MKKLFLLISAALIICDLWAQTPKYVFLFIGDGMAFPQRMVAAEFSKRIGRGELLINNLPVHATTRTSSANALITDSAASGTAIACGSKTNNGMIGMAPDGKKIQSVAEFARNKGKKVGIISSVNINHATPASFYGHRRSRSQYYELGIDMIESGFDFFGGGGVLKYNKEKIDIFTLLEKAGYRIVNGKTGLASIRPNEKVIALGNGKSAALPYAIDRDKSVPSLPEFVAKAIEVLDSPKGFFIMVEGGAIDWAGHANEAAANLYDMLEFDDSVKVAMDFYRKHPENTLIIVTGDHETGGMTMGFAGSGYQMDLELLRNQKISIGRFQQIMKTLRTDNKNLSFDDVKPLLNKYFGFVFADKPTGSPMYINPKELKMLQDGFAQKRLSRAVNNVINRKAGIGWASGNHTALPVLTTSIGKSAGIFGGFMENTDIANKLKSIL